MAINTISAPNAGSVVDVAVQAGEVLQLNFPTAEAMFERVDGDLVLNFDDGGQVVLENFFVVEEGEELPSFVFDDGSSLSGSDFLTALDIDVSPAAGPAAQAVTSSSLGSYDDGSADLVGGLDGLGKGDTISWETSVRGNDLHAEGATVLGAPGAPGVPGGPGGNENEGNGNEGNGNEGNEGSPGGNKLNYSARAVFHDADQDTDGKTNFYLLDAKGNPVSFEEGMEFTAVSQNGYFDNINPASIKFNPDGSLYLELSEAGRKALLDAMKAAGGKASTGNLYDYITITIDGREYVMQVVLNQNGKYNAADEDRLNPSSKGIQGEWHTDSHGTVDNDWHTGDGNDVVWNSGDLRPNAGQENLIDLENGNNTLTQKGHLWAQNGSKNTILGGSGKDDITVDGWVYSVGGGKNTIDTGSGVEDSITVNNSRIYAQSEGSVNTFKTGSTYLNNTDVYATGRGAQNILHNSGDIISKTNGSHGNILTGASAMAGGKNEFIADGDIEFSVTNSAGGSKGLYAEGNWGDSDAESEANRSSQTLKAGGDVTITAVRTAGSGNHEAMGVFANSNSKINITAGQDINITAHSKQSGYATGIDGNNRVELTAENGDIHIDVDGYKRGYGVFGGTKLNAVNGTVDIDVNSQTGEATAVSAMGTTNVLINAKDVDIQANSNGGNATGIYTYDGSVTDIKTNAGDIIVGAHAAGSGTAKGLHVSRASNTQTATKLDSARDVEITAEAKGSGNAFGMHADYGYNTPNYHGYAAKNIVNAKGDVDVTATAKAGAAKAMAAEKYGENRIESGDTITLNAQGKGYSSGMHANDGGKNIIGSNEPGKGVKDVIINATGSGDANSPGDWSEAIWAAGNNKNTENRIIANGDIRVTAENAWNNVGLKGVEQATNKLSAKGDITIEVGKENQSSNAFGVMSEYGGKNIISSEGDKGIKVTADTKEWEAQGLSSYNRNSENVLNAKGDVDISANAGKSGNARAVEARDYGQNRIESADTVHITAQGNYSAGVRASGGGKNIIGSNEAGKGVDDVIIHSKGREDGNWYKETNPSGNSPGTWSEGLWAVDGKNSENRIIANGDIRIKAENADGNMGIKGTEGALNKLSAKGGITVESGNEGRTGGWSYGVIAGAGGRNQLSAEGAEGISVTASNADRQTYALFSHDSGSKNELTASRVDITAESSSTKGSVGAMVAWGGGQNLIKAGNHESIIVTITAKSGSLTDEAIAMWADRGSVNRIEGGHGDNIVNITGSILGSGKNEIITKEGDDTITLNGAVNGSLNIQAGEGHDLLILKADNIDDFNSYYKSWLEGLTNKQFDGMSIEEITVYIGADKLNGQDLDWLQKLCDDHGVDLNFNVNYDASDHNVPDLIDFGEHDDVLIYTGEIDTDKHFNGGNGHDTMNLDKATDQNGNHELSFHDIKDMADSFEIIDLRGGSQNVLNMDELLGNFSKSSLSSGSFSEQNELSNLLSDSNSTVLRIHGDNDDSVALSSGNWSTSSKGSVEYDGITYDVYQSLEEQQYLLIQSTMTVN